MEKFLIPFKGRNETGPYNQNLLWKKDNLYIMDNHRAALWCWMQEISTSEKYNFLHIDQHYDTLSSQIKTWLKVLPDIEKISIQNYLNYMYADKHFNATKYPLFRFDNYLTIFFEKYSHILESVRFLTQDIGDKPNTNYVDLTYYEVFGNLDYWLESDKSDHIVNIDLDFFFREVEGTDYQIFSNDYILNIAEAISKIYFLNRIKVLTIALSPEFCNGWSNSESILNIFLKPFNIKFNL